MLCTVRPRRARARGTGRRHGAPAGAPRRARGAGRRSARRGWRGAAGGRRRRRRGGWGARRGRGRGRTWGRPRAGGRRRRSWAATSGSAGRSRSRRLPFTGALSGLVVAACSARPVEPEPEHGHGRGHEPERVRNAREPRGPPLRVGPLGGRDHQQQLRLPQRLQRRRRGEDIVNSVGEGIEVFVTDMSRTEDNMHLTVSQTNKMQLTEGVRSKSFLAVSCATATSRFGCT
ncbi:serine/arginine repetitive matrix protein 3-like [Hordeum vulgare subsp. vulgare]|uniref:serine/arginine repetitive matrix protein 3-like n=1 Tax=Hordeum vulgare subsp. vulgare TaxID=112509 RepID=UPI001D1A485A|nr:serine/arginine repetitive matrix protein 3-like [Hordeum vulgare subsp. vulgare]